MTVQVINLRPSWDRHTRYYKNKSRKKAGTYWRGVWEFLGIVVVLVWFFAMNLVGTAMNAAYGG